MSASYAQILWDFDGVLLDSMRIRSDGFRWIFRHYPTSHVDQLIAYHLHQGGLSRYHKIQYFFEIIQKESVDQEQIAELAQEFSYYMLERLQDPKLLIQDTVEWIRAHQRTHTHTITSGSDEQELKQLTTALGIAPLFTAIYGSPVPKLETVQRIVQSSALSKEAFCLIGDSINDYEAATAAGISFYGYNNRALVEAGMPYLSSLKEFGE